MRVQVEVKAENEKEQLIMQEVRKMVRKINTIPGIKNFQIRVETIEKEEK